MPLCLLYPVINTGLFILECTQAWIFCIKHGECISCNIYEVFIISKYMEYAHPLLFGMYILQCTWDMQLPVKIVKRIRKEVR